MAWHGGKTGLSRVCGRPPVKAGPRVKNPRQGPAPQRDRSRGAKTAERGAFGCHLIFLPYAAARGAPSAQVWLEQKEMTAEPEGIGPAGLFGWARCRPRVDLPLVGGEERSAQRSNRSCESIAVTNAGRTEGGELAAKPRDRALPVVARGHPPLSATPTSPPQGGRSHATLAGPPHRPTLHTGNFRRFPPYKPEDVEEW